MTDAPDPEAGAGAILLCGGRSRRFGAGDKTAQPLGDSTVLGHLVADLPSDWPLVGVGDPRPLPRPVTWTREEPPYAGPLAAIAAGLAALRRRGSPPLVVVAAGDQPLAGEGAPRLVDALRAAPADVDGVAARQPDGRAQLLLAAYRVAPLAARLTGDLTDRGVYRALAPLRVVTLDAGADAVLDVDTPADLARARRRR